MKNKGFVKKKLQIKSNWDKNLTLSPNDQQVLKGGCSIIATVHDTCTSIQSCGPIKEESKNCD